MWYANCRVLHNLWICNFVYVAYSTTSVENGHTYYPSILSLEFGYCLCFFCLFVFLLLSPSFCAFGAMPGPIYQPEWYCARKRTICLSLLGFTLVTACTPIWFCLSVIVENRTGVRICQKKKGLKKTWWPHCFLTPRAEVGHEAILWHSCV